MRFADDRAAITLEPLAVRQAIHDGGLIAKKWDVFISHASEDKDDLVRPLANALRALGLEVWYDEFEIGIGQSLTEAIDYGIANSPFGIVVLSPAFLGKKRWTSHELRGIMTGRVSGKQVILPLWHKVTYDDVYSFSPTLTDTVAYVTDDMTIEGMVAGIDKVVRRATV